MPRAHASNSGILSTGCGPCCRIYRDFFLCASAHLQRLDAPHTAVIASLSKRNHNARPRGIRQLQGRCQECRQPNQGLGTIRQHVDQLYVFHSSQFKSQNESGHHSCPASGSTDSPIGSPRVCAHSNRYSAEHDFSASLALAIAGKVRFRRGLSGQEFEFGRV